jgi:hypothetical protein
METINILLFSKFSQVCKKFVQILGTVPHIKNNITFLCVDNVKVREIIEKDKNLLITSVPCLLRIDEYTGYVETFEGKKAFDILDSYINFSKKTSPETSPESSKKKVSFVTPLTESMESEPPVAINTFFYVEPDQKEPERDEIIRKDSNIASKAAQIQKEREMLNTPLKNGN